MDIFEHQARQAAEQAAPLAARMRPRTLDEFWGQSHILAPGRLLRRAIEADQISSLIFYGPPGTGKTSLAHIIANTTQAKFIAINAVLAGIKDIRAAIAQAKQIWLESERRSILFIDEVHRFNKSQQDALLPWVENGTIVLIGATTENPYFEVNKALVSRSRVFELKPLQSEELRAIAMHALEDTTRGYGELDVEITEVALDHIINIANGDARALLNALELAVLTTDNNNGIRITLAVAEESIQQRAVLYDKEGDAHFDTISAFIKSVRGSDVDAALYWLARMVSAGESPNFIFRRLLILACEDIGLADPHAIAVVNACAQAFDRIGMPEGRYHLAHATIYLATAAKSNSTMAFFDALASVAKEKNDDVPIHLKDGNRDKQDLGHGVGYLYPHAYRDHWVAQQYLPEALQGKTFYQPSDQGYEATIKSRVERRREAQLALLDACAAPFLSDAELDTSEAWLHLSFDNATQRAQRIRDAIFDFAAAPKNTRVLDLAPGTGLLSWEALRRCPEGSTTALLPAHDEKSRIFQHRSSQLEALQRPVAVEYEATLAPFLETWRPPYPFDLIIANHCLPLDTLTLAESLARLIPLLADSGAILSLDKNPHTTTPISELGNLFGGLDKDLLSAWQQADRAIADSMTAKSDVALPAGLKQSGQRTLQVKGKLLMTPSILDHWFKKIDDQKSSYIQQLSKHIDENQRLRITDWVYRKLPRRHFEWSNRFTLTQWSKID